MYRYRWAGYSVIIRSFAFLFLLYLNMLLFFLSKLTIRKRKTTKGGGGGPPQTPPKQPLQCIKIKIQIKWEMDPNRSDLIVP